MYSRGIYPPVYTPFLPPGKGEGRRELNPPMPGIVWWLDAITYYFSQPWLTEYSSRLALLTNNLPSSCSFFPPVKVALHRMASRQGGRLSFRLFELLIIDSVHMRS